MDATLWMFADILQKLMASFAFLVGGAWVVWNYVKNRTHAPRLQVEVKAELVIRGDRHYLLATCQAKNVGLSLVRLPAPEPEGVGLLGSALVVRMLPQFGAEPYIIEVPWNENETIFEIFTGHKAIEPGLTISEQKLIYLSDLRYAAARVWLRVSAEGEKWSAVAVALPGEDLGKPASSLQVE